VSHHVVVYGREDCHLCEHARETVETVAAGMEGVTVEEVDVDTDPDLRDRYGDRVPVVAVDGAEAFAVRVAADDLRGLLS
jgi:glutaredoxin